jgi:hypothetical protein
MPDREIHFFLDLERDFSIPSDHIHKEDIFQRDDEPSMVALMWPSAKAASAVASTANAVLSLNSMVREAIIFPFHLPGQYSRAESTSRMTYEDIYRGVRKLVDGLLLKLLNE